MKKSLGDWKTLNNFYVGCIYCQVARKNQDDHSADMTKQTAKNVVKTIFQSPSPCVKIEFQGGDPSTDFPLVKYIIEEAEWQNLTILQF